MNKLLEGTRVLIISAIADAVALRNACSKKFEKFEHRFEKLADKII